MEMKDYNLTCGEVIDNLLTLADAYEKASAGKAPSGFAFNPTDAAANMKAAVHFIGSFGQQVPQWIPVSERLPEWGQFVIVAYRVACGPPEREVGAECHYADGVWTGCDKMRGGQPTHWMPMPAPPAE